jgi:DNA-binding transcriptional regulator YiaG
MSEETLHKMETGDPFEPPVRPVPSSKELASHQGRRPNMEKGKAKSAKGKAQRGPVMTGEALKAWREQRHLSRQALAEMLDIGTATLARYEIGGRMDRDRPGVTVEIPKTVRLAIAALSMGILDYDGTKTVGPPSFVTVAPRESSDERCG